MILTWAILTPVNRLMSPFGCTKCILEKIRPTSLVSVARTSTVLQNEKYTNWIIDFVTEVHNCLLTWHMSKGQYCFQDSNALWLSQSSWCHLFEHSVVLESNHHCVGNHYYPNCKWNWSIYSYTIKWQRCMGSMEAGTKHKRAVIFNTRRNFLLQWPTDTLLHKNTSHSH